MEKVLLVDWCQKNNNTIIPKEWDFKKNTSVDFFNISSKSLQAVWWKCSICGYEWKTRVGNRTANSSGCPACSNRVIWKGHNDLATTHPMLVKEWNFQKNGLLDPSDYTAGSNVVVWWKCKQSGHEWEAAIGSRTRGTGCPICSGNVVVAGINDLKSKNPSLVEEWDYEKNGDLLPSQVTEHSGKKAWWKCPICGHQWKAEIKARTNGSGCPVCSRKQPKRGINDITTTHPELLKEWDYGKNKMLNPLDYLSGSHSVVWWKCKTCGHEWQAQIKSRCSGVGCPKCKKQAAQITRSNHLAESNNTVLIKYPNLLMDWDYEKNTFDPGRTAPFSGEKVWWKCFTCKYEWEATISSRARGSGCPACSNKVVWQGHNDLATTHPELANEWDFEKNGNRLPTDYTAGSGVVVWWKCRKCGNEWETPINNRKGKPCPKCNSLVGTSEPEQIIYFYVKKAFNNAINRYKASWLKPFNEIDIYIPDIKMAIEYDGQRWHGDVQRDLEKDQIIQKHCESIIRFREEKCPIIDDGSYVIPVESGNSDSLVDGLKILFEYIYAKHSLSFDLSIDPERDKLEVLSAYKKSIGEDSLFYSDNAIVDEWNYEKNGDLSPKDFKCFSNTKVWWTCSTCGYEYESRIKVRFRSKKGNCPFCSGKVVIKGRNDLASQRPELLSEWDYDKNADLLPTMITAQSGKKVWWKCKVCNKSWLASVHDRGGSCNHRVK